MKNNTKTFSLPFLKHQEVAQNTYSFFFDRSSVDFDFLPGQYVRMTLPHPQPDERGTSRYFTIASSPLEKDYLMITTKMRQSTFKETLHNLKKGDTVHFFGPMGWFLQPEDEHFEKVFIAGGIGVTPFRSLLLTFHQQETHPPVTLLASFSKKEDAIFQEELLNISQQNPRVQVAYLFSDSDTGRISEAVLKQHIKEIHTPKYFVVGSIEMVAGTKELLQSLKIDEEKIFIEDFTGY